ncbi:MAG: glutamate-5-semialdehyde dehydrogenase [Candidatus Saganbacteria bacterium]|nr:glutamate-5-semialdehyde dehydrogenase [Candidatus Saganbacteria bacterium]
MATQELLTKGKLAKEASLILANVSTKAKNQALDEIRLALDKNAKSILEANKVDLEAGDKKGLSKAFLDRLALDGKRIAEIQAGLKVVKGLSDPVGEVLADWKRPNGLKIKKVRVPLGVIGIIYESRPNVTVDAASLCLKTGNATILRGGSDAINSNIALVAAISEAVEKAGLPKGTVQLIENTDRALLPEFLKLREFVDVIIPRGGADLIRMVTENSSIPVIETGEGNCHAYIEKTANQKMAIEIAINAKCSRPSVCNAVETLLVDAAIAQAFLPKLSVELLKQKVEIRGCGQTRKILPSAKEATEEDWEKEYNSLILAIKIVSGVEEAINHINKYGTRHSETIVTKNKRAAELFTKGIDAAVVYVNASTRFTDGGEFGFGAEIGISTQKLHARGPMGLPELTSYKYIIHGNGQIRA